MNIFYLRDSKFTSLSILFLYLIFLFISLFVYDDFGISTDEWVLRYEGLKNIKYIDEVYTYQTEEELYELIKFWKPDIRILGEDYIGKPFTGDDLPPKVIYTTRSHEWSTTKLKDLITKQTIKQNPEIAKK